MHTQTLIVGGGLAGLSLAYQLQQAGHDYRLVEARDRLGGRIKSLTVNGSQCDLGPSWVWSGQARVAQLLTDLDLRVFDQWSTGDQLYEQPSGEVMQNAGFMSMASAMRIAGGTSALTDALAARLDPTRVETGCSVASVDKAAHATLADGRIINSDRIVLCIPPRIAAQLVYRPTLPDNALAAPQVLPTWMGAHAKFVAVYQTAFWRNDGLSGDASSRRGPLAEIHDASPDDSSLGALFGFVGLPADARAQAGDTLQTAAIEQLVNLFGPGASNPIVTQLEDWSQATFTASPADATPPPEHPHYGMPRALEGVWREKLIFAVTELTSDNGGLIEGALAAAEKAARIILAR